MITFQFCIYFLFENKNVECSGQSQAAVRVRAQNRALHSRSAVQFDYWQRANQPAQTLPHARALPGERGHGTFNSEGHTT